MNHKRNEKWNELGFASIVIALIMIVILGLITLSFAQLSRREQKSSLDKQLASQAYYAAESGVNDVIENIDLIKGQSIDEDTCLTSGQMNSYGLKPNVNPNSGVTYSCVLVDLDPPTLAYSNINQGSSRATKFSTSGPMSEFRVKWGSADGKTGVRPAGAPTLPPANAWGNAPAVLQISLTPLTANFDRDYLISNTFTTYAYPGGTSPYGVGTVAYSSSRTDQGKIISSTCSDGGATPCSILINNIPSLNITNYLIRILVFYDKTNIDVAEARDVSGQNRTFVNGQIKIDVTGRAQDVLKRVSVRAPILKTPSNAPPAVVESQNLCKRELVDPSGTSSDQSPVFRTPCDPYAP